MFLALQVKRQIHEICRTRLSALHNMFPRSPSGAKNVKTRKKIEQLCRLTHLCYQFKHHMLQITLGEAPSLLTSSEGSRVFKKKTWRKETFLHLLPPNLHNTSIILMKVQARCRVSNNSQAGQFLSMKRAHIWHLAVDACKCTHCLNTAHQINSSKWW